MSISTVLGCRANSRYSVLHKGFLYSSERQPEPYTYNPDVPKSATDPEESL